MAVTTENMIYQVAKLYYIENMTQSDIASRLQLSRPKVSRLLAKAREQSIVQIYLKDPLNDDASQLEEELKAVFGLKHVLVVTSPTTDEHLNLQHIARPAAAFFANLLADGDTVGLAWGYTLLEIARNLPTVNLPESQIVQITGNLDNADLTNFAHDIVKQFSLKLNAKAAYTLPCPVIVENKIIVDLLKHDAKISEMLALAASAKKFLINIGVTDQNNCMFRTGYLKEEHLDHLKQAGAVGSVCSHFVDIQGNIVDPDLDERTFTIDGEALKKADVSATYICFENKIPALVGAMRNRWINTLVIDSNTAIKLLEQYGNT